MQQNSADLSVRVGELELKNPLIAASGTFGFGREMSQYMDLSRLGAIATKGFTNEVKAGNPPVRVAECRCGMLNAVGLQNPGLEHVLEHELPFMAGEKACIVANIAGACQEDYVSICRRLEARPIAAIELNLSCPNVKQGCLSFGVDPYAIESVVSTCKAVSSHPIWVKLTPNVTSIVETAKAAESGGADAISLINTLLGMAVDLRTRRPVLRNNTGGYSGPAIKPVALRMVSEVYHAVKIPVVGMGGIESASDVLEFIMAGASAVQIGTALLRNPDVFEEILESLPQEMERYGVHNLRDFCGSLKLW